ncbi:hypothetical protein ACVCH0_20725 [Burkholderia glumae]|uniref:hypothetical protein n=1 Tax=Burkholderia glumae TaxID=337 RepID=UPI0003A3481E|nr:hypothetical protein [Burkholderia glumae]MCM2544903.1 hypothetical protein [Burkholderia glumae]
MSLSARDVGKLFAIKLGWPIGYRGCERGHHRFIYRDPPHEHSAYLPDQFWVIERVRPEAVPIRTQQGSGFS